MAVTQFVQHSRVLFAMTRDFAQVVPDDKWDYTPVPPGTSGRPPTEGRIGDGFAPFSKQLRHVVCVRGVYNDALATGAVDWSRKHEHYAGPFDREPLLAALADQQERLVKLVESADPDIRIDWGGFTFSLEMFTGEFVQHEAIHHGQWSVYAALGGFDTPVSWHRSWGL